MHARICLALLTLAPLAVSTPIDADLAAVIASNLNLACQNGCAGASSAQQLDTSAALGSRAAMSPLSLLGGFALAGGVLAAL